MKLNIQTWKEHMQELEDNIRVWATYTKELGRHIAKPAEHAAPQIPRGPDLFTRIGISGGYSAPAGSDLRMRYECMTNLLREKDEKKSGHGDPYMTMLYSIRAHLRKSPRVHCKGFTLEEQAAFLEKCKPLWERFIVEETTTQEIVA